jgi:pimeloyl-ACP methyl ester carboxylesterase
VKLRIPPTGWGAFSPARYRGGWLLATLMIAMLFGLPHRAAGQDSFTEESGTLPDGTLYRIRVPANWNKTLIRDLDFAGAADSARNRYLLEKGYAMSGTQRHVLRPYRYDPAREIANLKSVQDRVEARFGKPDRVIQYGCSGGGNVGLEVAEDFPEQVDGVIAMAAHTPVWFMNSYLDGWVALKVLIAPDLEIVNSPNTPASDARQPSSPAAWRQAIDNAQKTPEGRARIALALTLGQWPAWASDLISQPNLDDVTALQHSLYHTAFQLAATPGGPTRAMFQNAANGEPLSWTTGVDYKEFFENGNESLKRAVRQLYQQAGLDLQADLDRINAAPRISASPYALDFWKARGHTVRGNPKIPVLRMHEVGDPSVLPSVVQGYEEQISANGKEDLFRVVYVNAATHCGINAAESGAAVETLLRRLDTGQWERTDPEAMNERAASLGADAPPRFTSMDKFRQVKFNRVWIPE